MAAFSRREWRPLSNQSAAEEQQVAALSESFDRKAALLDTDTALLKTFEKISGFAVAAASFSSCHHLFSDAWQALALCFQPWLFGKAGLAIGVYHQSARCTDDWELLVLRLCRQQLMQPLQECEEAQAINQDWLDKLVLTYLQQERELQVCLLLPHAVRLSSPVSSTRLPCRTGRSTLHSKPSKRL